MIADGVHLCPEWLRVGELVKDGGFKRSGTVAGFREFQRQRLPAHSSRRRLQITLAGNAKADGGLHHSQEPHLILLR